MEAQTERPPLVPPRSLVLASSIIASRPASRSLSPTYFLKNQFSSTIVSVPASEKNRCYNPRGTRNKKSAPHLVFWSPRQGGRGGGAYAFVAGLSHLAIDHVSFSRRSIVPTPNRDTSNIWALIVFFVIFTYPLPVSPSVATAYMLG